MGIEPVSKTLISKFFWNLGRWTQSKSTFILIITLHHQNPSEFTRRIANATPYLSSVTSHQDERADMPVTLVALRTEPVSQLHSQSQCRSQATTASLRPTNLPVNTAVQPSYRQHMAPPPTKERMFNVFAEGSPEHWQELLHCTCHTSSETSYLDGDIFTVFSDPPSKYPHTSN
jgi:hypothetical protein